MKNICYKLMGTAKRASEPAIEQNEEAALLHIEKE
jgi:hypothetical protein